MDNKKFETLIDLIINENEEQARQLFHEIIVEKSREIYESIMEEEMMDETMHGDMDDGMVGEVGSLLDEISAEEAGSEMSEDEDEDDDMLSIDDEETIELEPEDGEDENLEDRIGDLEEKVDEIERLMAEFEAEMGGGEMDDMDDMEDMEDTETVDMEDDEETAMMENVQLAKVSVTHGDNGAQTKSPGLQNSGQAGMDSKPVKFSGQAETVPTGPKAPSNYATAKEGNLPGAGSFKNVPGGKAKVDLASAPKPVTKDASPQKHSPVAKG